MRRTPLYLLCACVVSLAAVGSARAQNAQSPTPEIRYISVTSFDVPYGDRAVLVPWMEEYVLPYTQLNPKVLNFRYLTHDWGSDGSQVVLVAEYANFGDVNSDCGDACKAYNDAHKAPKKGEAGYDKYHAGEELFNKYFSKHSDEIYVTNMRRAVVNGKPMGTPGPQPASDDGM